MGTTVRLNNVTISYPNLFVARASQFNADVKKYTASFIMDKGDANHEALNAAMDALKGGAPKGTKFAEASFYDGDSNSKVNDDPRNHGKMVLRTSRVESQGAPGVFDEKAQPVMDQGKVYAGCKVNADVDVYVGRTGGARICFAVVQVQFAGDGERLDGAVPPPAFAPLVDDTPNFLD